MAKPPLVQLIEQMDAEGRIVFQGTLMLGYTPRQALYNAFGLGDHGIEVDCWPEGANMIYHAYKDERLIKLFTDTPKEEIERVFWAVVENEAV
jgi:hypothetical protein